MLTLHTLQQLSVSVSDADTPVVVVAAAAHNCIEAQAAVGESRCTASDYAIDSQTWWRAAEKLNQKKLNTEDATEEEGRTKAGENK